SAWTNEATETTMIAPPASPSGLHASAVTTTQISLGWSDNSSNETAFALWRKSGAGDWTRIAVLVPNTTSYADTGLTSGTGYTYRVRAIGQGGASNWSNEDTETT